MKILFKDVNGMVLIHEDELKSLMNDCFNEGYDLGYFDGYSESNCSCGCSCEHDCEHDCKEEKNEEDKTTSTTEPVTKGHIKIKTNNNGKVNEYTSTLENFSFNKLLDEMRNGGWLK
jgi:hypothetical protein